MRKDDEGDPPTLIHDGDFPPPPPLVRASVRPRVTVIPILPCHPHTHSFGALQDKLQVRRVARCMGRYRGSGCSGTASVDTARAHSGGSKAQKPNSAVVRVGDDHTKKSSRTTSSTTTSTDIVAASATTCAIANRTHIDQRSRHPNHHLAFRGITVVTMRDMAQVWPYS